LLLALCGINDSSNHTLVFKNMNPKQIQECLGDIFYDYKTHFSAYKLDDMITIKSPDGTEGITDIKKFDISKQNLLAVSFMEEHIFPLPCFLCL
jgi:hypothetical protein